ncbi:hypothetical protein V6N13_018739 [Hibiscus sabdariffa]
MELNCKALHIVFYALGPDEYAKVSSCDSAKEVWDKLQVIHEYKRSKDLKKLKLDELIGSLLTHELISKPLIREKERKIKEQGTDVNVIALKSSKKHQEDSSEDESEEDDEMAYLVNKFTRFMKSEKEKYKHESKKKMKEPQRAQSSNKRGSSSKKAYVATWSDEKDSTDNEVTRLCFMALQEGKAWGRSLGCKGQTSGSKDHLLKIHRSRKWQDLKKVALSRVLHSSKEKPTPNEAMPRNISSKLKTLRLGTSLKKVTWKLIRKRRSK